MYENPTRVVIKSRLIDLYWSVVFEWEILVVKSMLWDKRKVKNKQKKKTMARLLITGRLPHSRRIYSRWVLKTSHRSPSNDPISGVWTVSGGAWPRGMFVYFSVGLHFLWVCILLRGGFSGLVIFNFPSQSVWDFKVILIPVLFSTQKPLICTQEYPHAYSAPKFFS